MQDYPGRKDDLMWLKGAWSPNRLTRRQCDTWVVFLVCEADSEIAQERVVLQGHRLKIENDEEQRDK